VRQLLALARKDARIVVRDSFLVAILLYTLVLALVARVAVPRVPVPHLSLYLAPAMVLFGALLLGTVLGFALIEESEQGTWQLLRVLPLDPATLFLYLGSGSGLISAVLSLLAVLLYGQPVADVPAFLLLLGVSSLSAPLMMLLLGALASNKIEGLAVSKILSLVLLTPAAVFVLPMPWQLLLAWSPFYWIYLGLLRAFAGDTALLPAVHWPGLPPWLEIVAPLCLLCLGNAALVQHYRRRVL
jgi:fluoroquinolone transport system permease protein